MLVQGRVLARHRSSGTTHGLGTLLPVLGGAEHFLMDALLPPEVLAAPWFAAEDHRRAESSCAFLRARPSPICRTCLWLALPQGRLHAASCSPSSNTNSTLGSSCQNPCLASTGKHQALPLPKAMCSH